MKISTISTKKHNILQRLFVILIWLLIWYVAAILISNDILMVPPHKVLLCLVKLLFVKEFYLSIAFSIIRVLLGLVAGIIIGTVLGELSYKNRIVEYILSPFMSVIKSVPVASFIVLLLIWFGSSKLSFFISFLIVLPNVYESIRSGFNSTDEKLLHMSKVFGYSAYQRLIYIYKDYVLPYLIGNLKVTIGLAFKSGIAAEVIGLTNHSIGARIYMSKIYLETGDLFAYTIVAIIISFIFEKLIIASLNRLLSYHKAFDKGLLDKEDIDREQACFEKSIFTTGDAIKPVKLENINVSFDEKTVLNNLSLELEGGEIYAVMGASGIGKTTLINEIYSRSKVKSGVAFQEDLLLENYDGLTNIMLGHKKLSVMCALDILRKCLPDDSLRQKVSEFSGGMKRRLNVIRALSYDCDMVLLDEPFSGLDDDNRKNMISIIKELRFDRIIVVVTHNEDDVKLLNAKIISL